MLIITITIIQATGQLLVTIILATCQLLQSALAWQQVNHYKHYYPGNVLIITIAIILATG